MCVQVMEMVSTRAKPFSYFTYRSVGSGSGQDDILAIGLGNQTVSKSDFSAGDLPLSSQQWQDAQTSGNPVAQVPLLLGSVSIFYSPDLPLVSLL